MVRVERGADVDSCGGEVGGPGGVLVVDGKLDCMVDDDGCRAVWVRVVDEESWWRFEGCAEVL